MQIPLKFPEVDRDKTMLERDKKKKNAGAMQSIVCYYEEQKI